MERHGGGGIEDNGSREVGKAAGVVEGRRGLQVTKFFFSYSEIDEAITDGHKTIHWRGVVVGNRRRYVAGKCKRPLAAGT